MSNILNLHCDSASVIEQSEMPITVPVSDKAIVFTQGNISEIELVEIESKRVLRVNTASDRWVIEELHQQRLFLQKFPKHFFEGAFKLMALYQDLCSFNEDF